LFFPAVGGNYPWGVLMDSKFHREKSPNDLFLVLPQAVQQSLCLSLREGFVFRGHSGDSSPKQLQLTRKYLLFDSFAPSPETFPYSFAADCTFSPKGRALVPHGSPGTPIHGVSDVAKLTRKFLRGIVSVAEHPSRDELAQPFFSSLFRNFFSPGPR